MSRIIVGLGSCSSSLYRGRWAPWSRASAARAVASLDRSCGPR